VGHIWADIVADDVAASTVPLRTTSVVVVVVVLVPFAFLHTSA
jgi:hypothetical protein